MSNELILRPWESFADGAIWVRRDLDGKIRFSCTRFAYGGFVMHSQWGRAVSVCDPSMLAEESERLLSNDFGIIWREATPEELAKAQMKEWLARVGERATTDWMDEAAEALGLEKESTIRLGPHESIEQAEPRYEWKHIQKLEQYELYRDGSRVRDSVIEVVHNANDWRQYHVFITEQCVDDLERAKLIVLKRLGIAYRPDPDPVTKGHAVEHPEKKRAEFEIDGVVYRNKRLEELFSSEDYRAREDVRLAEIENMRQETARQYRARFISGIVEELSPRDLWRLGQRLQNVAGPWVDGQRKDLNGSVVGAVLHDAQADKFIAHSVWARTLHNRVGQARAAVDEALREAGYELLGEGE